MSMGRVYMALISEKYELIVCVSKFLRGHTLYYWQGHVWCNVHPWPWMGFGPPMGIARVLSVIV